MKILLTTLNAKYVHTSLGLWYIYQYCRSDYPELLFKEYNINQELAWVLGEIYLTRAEVVAFSCNIWNIEETLTLCQRLKEVTPETTIVLGGPEVWAEPVQIMESYPAVDFIVIGEGELTFKEWLCQYRKAQPDWGTIAGLVYRNDSTVVVNMPRPQIENLGIIPFPYPANLTEFRNKLVYYETSRGCPYQCQYCLSANEQGVRFFPQERVKQELLQFVAAGVAQVKLVDRSFNCNPRWAKELWRFLITHAGSTNFHFEIVGDLLDEEALALLRQAPAGLFQFEIGIQSTNRETLTAIQRKMDFERLRQNVTQLVQTTAVFVHVDLIAGLPWEDYQSFARTFNETLAMRPHRLQLGFLKLLQGSGLRKQAAEYGYRFTREAPYEILSNLWLSYPELVQLKRIEDLLDRYYNSGRFGQSLEYCLSRAESAFAWFERFSDWWKKQGLDEFAHKTKDLYGYLLRFAETVGGWGAFELETLRNRLKFDLLNTERMVELPDWAGPNQPDLKNFGFRFWKDVDNRQRYFPESPDLEARDIQRRTLFASFTVEPLAEGNDGPESKLPVAERVYLFIYGQAGVKYYKIAPEG
ncbi:MAG TPA: B12-binding domain-containing radical SAM protein [Bacillota bacterium]|nr:B12-binding domain-containing radical SAM protein [Bacillota bacterium]